MARLRRIILPSTITPEGMFVNSMESLGYDAAHQQAEYIFRTVLPACGMTVREGQIQLCHAMLDSLYNKEVTLCDAGVGLGKTYAYLIACLLWQWQRPREQWQPVVISTASVTLQDALLQQYIPFLSNVLIQYGYIGEPVHAVLRKGKERFACDARLQERRIQIAQRGEAFARRAALLRAADRYLDLDRVAGLSRYDRRHICVPDRCDRQCGAWDSCRYRQYVRASNGPTITIQICNHNYLLADALHRQKGWKPLLRDYQALVIDEAHSLPDAEQQMTTRRLSVQKLTQLAEQLARAHHPYAAQQVQARALAAACNSNAPAEGKARRAFAVTEASAAALAGMQKVVTQILEREHTRLPRPLQNQLAETKELAGQFARPDDSMIRYIEMAGNGASFSFCAVPRDLPGQLYDLLWKREKPAILTSGTLAAGGDFTPIRRQMGLCSGAAVQTVQVPSPFDYTRNAMLYFPPRSSVRDSSKEAQNERVAGQIESLVRSACGHTLVLFTSYDQMGHVYEQLEGRLPYPLYKAARGGQRFVEQFKQCPNAVLLAGGPCWEGVDFPGDMVSLLVIVRLPFPVPDPVREAQRECYPDLHSYIQTEIVPEMQQKLRQGFGRAIRTESDSCAVAILDPRAAPGGRYHRTVLDSLPAGIPIMTDDIQTFLRAHKSPDYFLPNHSSSKQKAEER